MVVVPVLAPPPAGDADGEATDPADGGAAAPSSDWVHAATSAQMTHRTRRTFMTVAHGAHGCMSMLPADPGSPLHGGTVASVGETGVAWNRPFATTNATLVGGSGSGPQ